MGIAFELFGEHEVQPALNRLKSHLQSHVHLTLLMRNPQSDDGDAIWTVDDLQAVEDAVRRFKERDQPPGSSVEDEAIAAYRNDAIYHVLVDHMVTILSHGFATKALLQQAPKLAAKVLERDRFRDAEDHTAP